MAKELDVDDGHQVLNSLIAAYKGVLLSEGNEAETRFKVIDGVLRKVLGWTDDDMRVEERVVVEEGTKFIDYTIRTASTLLIVEAKRAGAAFTLPANRTSGKLGGFLSEGDIGKAISQVSEYCAKASAQFAAVTNGAAWIVFPAIRTDGIAYVDTQARIFRSLEDIQQRFVEFWELLSRQRVIEGSLHQEFFEPSRETVTRRPITLLREPGYRLARNSLYPLIESAIVAAFTDEGLLRDPQAISNCYVKTAERVKFDERLNLYLSDLKPGLGHPSTRVRGRKHEDYLDQQIAAAGDVQTAPYTPQIPRFFLILGPVGAGKSLFLEYTRHVSAKASIDKKILWLYIDFKQATESDPPRKFIYRALLDHIEQDRNFDLGDWDKSIQPAYADQMDALRRGPYKLLAQTDVAAFNRAVVDRIERDLSEIEPYVDRVLAHARASRPGFLVIDNVDQIENESIQQKILSESLAIAHKIGFNVIMSLRDSTYLDNRNTARFDAFQFDSIYVDPPSILPVLSRRFTYASSLLAKRPGDIQASSGPTFRFADLSVFIELVASSLLSGDAAQMLDVLSAHDVRRGLTLTRQFLSSGHITADEAIKNYLTDKQFRFPPHEVFKGSVLGNRKFYREEESLLPNVFCSKLGIPSLQQLRLRILHYFVTSAAVATFEGTRGDDLVEILARLGVSQQDVETVLTRLVAMAMLRVSDGGKYRGSVPLVPTRLSAYVLTQLAARFNYLEMCMLDATIHDDDTWIAISDLTSQIQAEPNRYKGIDLRILRAREFVRYVKGQEERWVVEARRRGLHELWTQQVILNSLLPGLEKDFEQVKASAERMQVRTHGFQKQ